MLASYYNLGLVFKTMVEPFTKVVFSFSLLQKGAHLYFAEKRSIYDLQTTIIWS